MTQQDEFYIHRECSRTFGMFSIHEDPKIAGRKDCIHYRFRDQFFVAYYSITRKTSFVDSHRNVLVAASSDRIRDSHRVLSSCVSIRFMITGLNTASIESGCLNRFEQWARQTFDYLSSKRGYVPRNLALQRVQLFHRACHTLIRMTVFKSCAAS